MRSTGPLQWPAPGAWSDRWNPPSISVGRSGTVYVWAYNGNLYAINPDGSQRWAFETGSIKGSMAFGKDGTIYARAIIRLFAINPDGSQKWVSGMKDRGPDNPVAVGPDGSIYTVNLGTPGSWTGIGLSRCSFCALNPDGSLKWAFRPTVGFVDSVVVGPDGVIYVSTNERGAGRLYVLSPAGSQKWVTGTFNVMSVIIRSDGTIISDQAHLINKVDLVAGVNAFNPDGSSKWALDRVVALVAGSDGTIYGTSSEGLCAIGLDGSLKWTYHMKEAVISVAAGTDGTVYATALDTSKGSDSALTLYAIRPGGSHKWSLMTGQGAGSVAVGTDGTVYVASRDGNVYAVGTEDISTITGDSQTGTPISEAVFPHPASVVSRK